MVSYVGEFSLAEEGLQFVVSPLCGHASPRRTSMVVAFICGGHFRHPEQVPPHPAVRPGSGHPGAGHAGVATEVRRSLLRCNGFCLIHGSCHPGGRHCMTIPDVGGNAAFPLYTSLFDFLWGFLCSLPIPAHRQDSRVRRRTRFALSGAPRGPPFGSRRCPHCALPVLLSFQAAPLWWWC